MNGLRHIVLSLLVLVAAGLCTQDGFAEIQCPWLNAATAAGVLGGEVQASASAPSAQGDVTCDFRRATQSLRIEVHTMMSPSREFTAYLAQCEGTTAPLRAIGNEAVQCVPNKGQEQIIGRVRDHAFVITLKTLPQASARDPLSSEARNVAEQVAGALF